MIVVAMMIVVLLMVMVVLTVVRVMADALSRHMMLPQVVFIVHRVVVSRAL